MDLRLPSRKKGGHKGTFGTVAIAGGSITKEKVMIGGAAFAARAAIRSGAGMITFVNKKEALIDLIEMVPQATGVIRSHDYSKEAKKWKSIVLGPALGNSRNNIKVIGELLKLNLPTVIDADGLNTIAEHPDLAVNIHKNCVLTPHPGELSRLSKAFMVRTPDELASELRCTIVSKDSDTHVIGGGRNWINSIPNPALATGGTGDVLSGLIGGLMAQYCPGQLTAFECACLGVKIHSKAGIEWKNRHGSSGLIVDELLELIPEVMEKMRGV